MGDYNELVSICKHLLFERFAPAPAYIRGLLGDGQGNVLVPDRPDYNYARFNRSSTDVFEIFNKEVSQPIDNLPILIGEYPWQPGLTQVVGIDWATYNQIGWGNTYANLQAHASTHEWPDLAPGSDYTRTYLRSIVPLQGYGAGSGTSYNFYAQPYEYDYTGTSQYWPGLPPISLAGALPATGTMRYMGVYLNPATNQLGAVSGSAVAYVDNSEPPRPKFPLNVYPVAYARLYGGQQFIAERDTRDARRLWNNTLIFTGTSSGGGGGWAFTNVKRVSTTNAFADYATSALAIAGITSGQLALFDAETFTTDNVTQATGKALAGWSRSNSILRTTTAVRAINATGTVEIDHLSIENTQSAASTIEALRIASGSVRDVDIEAVNNSNNPAASARGVYVTASATTTFDNCFIRGACPDAAAGDAIGMYIAEFSSVTIDGGEILSTEISITAEEFALVKLNGPRFTGGGVLAGLGTYQGWYYDNDDNIVIVSGSGFASGVWLQNVSTGMLVRYASTTLAAAFALALAAAVDGDAIICDAGTFTFSANVDINKAITVRGVLGKTVFTTATNSLTLITLSDAATLQDLTITNTGAGTGGAGVFWTASGAVIDNCTITVSGAGTTNYGIGPSGAVTGTVKNTKITVSGGTNNYGFAAVVGNSTTEIYGGKISGSTYDIYGTIAGATLTLLDPILVNSLISFTGAKLGNFTDSGGSLVIFGTSDIKGLATNTPDIGTTTLAEKFGNIYLGTSKDVFASDDSYAIFNRLVNYGFTPDEHWRQNADELSWTGWASYTGFATPSIISTSNSIYRVANAGATKAFRYRAAATGDYIYLRARVAITFLTSAGIMVDDGVNNADGNGANNFYRVYLTQAVLGGAVTAVEQYRTGGGAVTTNASTFTLAPHLFYGVQIFTTGTRWTSWTAQPALFGESGERVTFTSGAAGLTWTPARVGLYWVGTASDGSRKGLWDWYDEAVS